MVKTLKGSSARNAFVLLACASLLSACGGGGDGGSGGTDDPILGIVAGSPGGSGIFGSYFVLNWAAQEQEAENRRNHSKYTSQTGNWNIAGATRSTNAILSSGVEYAHAAGLTGLGQIVAVIDAGFRKGHEALAGAILSSSPADAVDGHGTSVAAIIAGESSSFIGIAPGAQLYLQDFASTYQQMANATTWALNNGAVAQNNSWGPTDGSNNELLATTSGLNAFIGQGATPYLNALSAYAAQGVVIFAVSNEDSLTQIDLMAGLPGVAGYQGLEDGWLAVGNGFPVFNSSGKITNVYMMSSSCLQAVNWCLVANGQWEHVPTADSNTSYDYNLGSSFAAPQVAGAMALLAEAFPLLDEHDLRIRLLASADNSYFSLSGVNEGTLTSVELAPGYFHQFSSVYGAGFLDIAAALMPIGAPLVTTMTGKEIDTSTAWLKTGSAMGDAVQRSLEGVDVKVTDALAADFALSGDKLFAQSQPASLAAKALPRAISTDLTALRLAAITNLTDIFGAQEGRTVDLADPTGAVSATLLVPDAGSDNVGIALMRSLQGEGFRFNIGLKVARDDGTFIGFGDAGQGGATTKMASIQMGVSQDIAANGFVSLNTEFGLADLGKPDGFSSVSNARFNAVGVELGSRSVFTGGDRLAFGVSLPMAVTSGSAALDLPTFGTRAAGDSAFDHLDVDLSPNSRQIDMSVSYMMPLGDDKELMLKALHAENYGNIAGVTDNAVVAAFKWSF